LQKDHLTNTVLDKEPPFSTMYRPYRMTNVFLDIENQQKLRKKEKKNAWQTLIFFVQTNEQIRFPFSGIDY